MSEKGKNRHHEPVGQLGKIFKFSRDDLAANRAGFMTLPQQFGFNFTDRRLFGWLFRIPPMQWVKPRPIIKISGTIKKQFTSRIVYTGSGGSGGGHQELLEQRRLEMMTSDAVITFYVKEKEFAALPENIDITLYYDPLYHRIISVEPPYENTD